MILAIAFLSIIELHGARFLRKSSDSTKMAQPHLFDPQFVAS